MEPKVVLITGCSNGIGFETAVLLASDERGYFKVFATMRNLAKQNQLKAAAGDTLGKTLFIRELDVTKEDSITGFMKTINQEEGGVDILINNAGIGQGGLVEKVPMQKIRTLFETNVFGLIRLTQLVMPGMKAKKSGHIVNVGSIAGLIGIPYGDVYSSTKFAVEGFSQSIAPMLRQFNVSVSVIEPGPVATSFAETAGGYFAHDTSVDPDVDELTHQLYEKAIKRHEQANPSVIQTGKEVARIIQEVILSEKPKLNNQTSEKMKGLAAKLLVDPTGESVINIITKKNGWDE